jgi:hypothetical protein
MILKRTMTNPDLVLREGHAYPDLTECRQLVVDVLAIKVPAEHEIALARVDIARFERDVAVFASATLGNAFLELPINTSLQFIKKKNGLLLVKWGFFSY